MKESSASAVSSQGFEYGVKHFYSTRDAYVTEILFESLGIENARSTELLNLGAIYINNKRCLSNEKISENSLLRVHTKPRRYLVNYDWKSLIVFDCEDFVVLNKPPEIPSHPSVDNQTENSLTQLALAIDQKLFITHRLDSLTNGLIVYSKNQSFSSAFNIQLQNKMIEKHYVALVEKTSQLPKTLIHYMEPSPRAPKKVSPSFQDNWSFCELSILEQKNYSAFSWIKINLLTGRTHQIRAQLSESGAPILGDKMYGSNYEYQSRGIALRACELRFLWGNQEVKFNLSEDFDI